MKKLSNIIWLDLLWLLHSIPIVTIGASTAAMYYVAYKMEKGDERSVRELYEKAFRENMKKSTIIWLCYLILAVILGYGLQRSFFSKVTVQPWIKVIIVLGTIVYAFSLSYVFPLIARYENSIRNTIINSLILSLRYIKQTLAMVLVLIAFGLIGFYHWILLIPCVILLAGPICLVNSHFLLKLFQDFEASVEKSRKLDEELKKELAAEAALSEKEGTIDQKEKE